MAKNYLSKLVGAFGDPIEENPSVVMMEAAFRAMGLDWRYINFKIGEEDLAEAFTGLKAMGFSGINLTIPHKVNAVQYMDQLTPNAQLIGAINTVIAHEGALTGDNTDGRGFVRSLSEQGINLKDKRLVILGAGGAARAICVESAMAGCATIDIINRNEARGQALCELIAERTPADAGFTRWTGTAHIPECDILVNATDIGLYPDPNRPDIVYEDIHPGMIVQDIIPNPANTWFLQTAARMGAKTFDGLGMLVWQGAIAIKLWTGLDAPVDIMKMRLEQEFALSGFSVQ